MPSLGEKEKENEGAGGVGLGGRAGAGAGAGAVTTWLVRVAPLAFAAAATHSAANAWMDDAMAWLWRCVLGFWPSHWAMAEAIVATAGFWTAGTFFEVCHGATPSN